MPDVSKLESYLIDCGYQANDALAITTAYINGGIAGVEKFAKEWADGYDDDEHDYSGELIGYVNIFFNEKVKVMPITKDEIKILEDNDWEVVCESPLNLEKQFGGCVHTLSTKKEMREELAEIARAKAFKEWLKDKKEEEALCDAMTLKQKVKDILTKGITEDTLLAFYKTRGHPFSSLNDQRLKSIFKEAFDEVSSEDADKLITDEWKKIGEKP